MLQKLIEELEVILNETNKVKQSLNMKCEKIWYLHSPSGIKGRGSFTIKNLSNSSKMNVSSSSESKPSSSAIHDNKVPFSLEDVIGNVSDLIAYGKHIRETVNVENINKGKKCNSSILYKPIDQCKSNKDTIKSRGQQQMQKLDSRSNLGVKHKIWNKSLNSQEIPHSDAVSACLDKHKKKDTNTNERNEQKLIAGCKSANKSSLPDIYHHSCSVNLTESAESFKVPSDLLYLLKLYRHYENDKLKKNQDADNFSEKFYNQIKSKLENNIKNNCKQEERYIKYLDVADRVYKSLKAENIFGRLQNSRVQYKSKEQLYLLESRYQNLMEKQLQERLLSVINSTI